MYKYPQDLIDYLTEQEADGRDIFITQNEDGTVFMIPHSEEWVIFITWYDGEDKFNMVNICGKSFNRLKKLMGEMDFYARIK